MSQGFNTRDVFWRHLSPSDELVASFSRGSMETEYRSRFFGRAQLLSNFTLEIRSLELGDTGTFTSLLVDTGGLMELRKFHLTVYEAVTEPTVQVFTSGGGAESGTCEAFLNCVTARGNNVSYSWRAETGQRAPINTTHVLHDGGKLIRVLLTPADREVAYTCTVTNPVSRGHAAVVPWNSCATNSGAGGDVYTWKYMPYIAASLAIMFTAGTLWVFLCTKASGKKNRARVRQQEEETAQQHVLETQDQEQPEDGPQCV
ncbi:SLAM family member 8 isoform X2 [Ascaphus truei]